MIQEIEKKAKALVRRCEEDQLFRTAFHHVDGDVYLFCTLVQHRKIYGVAVIAGEDGESLKLKNAMPELCIGAKEEFLEKVGFSVKRIFQELEEERLELAKIESELE